MTCRLHLLLVLIIFAQGVISYVKEAPDGSICFNNCNGHGDCVDYSCHCWSGYHGDDCGHTFVKEGEPVVPILSAGHYNLTRKNFTSGITKNKFILVGFSAYSCHRCIAVEPEYEKVKNALTILDIPFARADVDQMKSIALEHEANELPALVLFHKVHLIITYFHSMFIIITNAQNS
jgi:thiol-disulfide isomerase/thioredoxin